VLPQSRRRKRDHMRQQVASVSGDPLEQAHWGRTTIVIASHRAFKAPIGLLAIRILTVRGPALQGEHAEFVVRG
jgi:hypothetical protein